VEALVHHMGNFQFFDIIIIFNLYEGQSLQRSLVDLGNVALPVYDDFKNSYLAGKMTIKI
jgi:hypothetical protein